MRESYPNNSFKDFMHILAYRLGLSTMLAKRQSVRRILMLHGVGGTDCPIDVFNEVIRYLRRHFDLVHLPDIYPIESGNGVDRRLAITFDDGLRNNVHLAYPVLKAASAPATFFICPALIDRGAWLWNSEVRERLNSVPTKDLPMICEQLGCTIGSVEQIVQWMKTIRFGDRIISEEKIRTITPGFRITEDMRFRYDLASWEELFSLDPHLITIGGHTMSHHILSTLDDEMVEFEIVQCKRESERRLGRPVTTFAYPDGKYDERVLQIVRNHYKYAVTTEENYLRPLEDQYLLPRIAMTDSTPYLSWRLMRPSA